MSNENPFVRVKDTVTGHEYSVATSALDAERHSVLEGREAVDASGDPLPAKPSIPKGEAKNHREQVAAPSHSPSTAASGPNHKE